MGNSQGDERKFDGLDGVRRRSITDGGVAMTGRFHAIGMRDFKDDYTQSSQILGSGMNGKVFLAKSKKNKLNYAIKPFNLQGVSEETRQELMTECEIFLAMDHPNVGRLVDVYETAEQLLLVTECMEGGEVYSRIAAKKKFTDGEARSTVRQMMVAVNYLHGQGVAHRDIKLENFLYSSKTSDELKLIDFGFGSYVKKNQAMDASCGTLSYIAPEVLNKRYDEMCDLWSMGVVSFILLSGYMPFRGDKGKMTRDIKAGNFEWRQDKWQGVEEDAIDFVKKLLVVDPTARLTAEQALEHRWLAQDASGGRDRAASFDNETVQSLVAFQKASHFKKTALRVMAWSLTLPERQELREVFLAVDTDRRGTIGFDEFKAALKDTLVIEDASLNELWESLKGVCKHDPQDVHYSDFLAAMCTTRVEMHETLLRDTFKRFDVDNCGNITVSDLTSVLGDKAEAEEMMRLVDTDGNGHIDYQEFVNLIKMDGVHAEGAMDKVSRIIDRELSVAVKSNSSRSVRSKKSADAKAGCCSCFAWCR